MESGDILGHENMGEVIELGSEVTNLAIGDRVVVPFTISCGQCWFCQQGLPDNVTDEQALFLSDIFPS